MSKERRKKKRLFLCYVQLHHTPIYENKNKPAQWTKADLVAVQFKFVLIRSAPKLSLNRFRADNTRRTDKHERKCIRMKYMCTVRALFRLSSQTPTP